MSNDVVSEIAAWTARAAAARAAGVELEALSQELGNVVASNYFGLGCDEGLVVYSTLHKVIQSGIEALVSSAQTANTLAKSAVAAGSALTDTDAANASSLRSQPR